VCSQTVRGQRARAEIVAAGRVELLEAGPENLSLRAVARRAGYAPSALYNHFRDRDELIVALAMDSVGELSAYLGAVRPNDVLDRLTNLGHAYLRFATEHPEGYRVIFDCLANPPHSWAEYVTVAHPFTLIVDACRQALDDGALADPAGIGPSGLAYGMWALVDGHIHLRTKHLAHIDGPFEVMFDSALRALLGIEDNKENAG